MYQHFHTLYPWNHKIFSAPGVADLAAAGNWAEEYLAAEARNKSAVATSGGGPNWAAEFLEGRVGVPRHPVPIGHPNHPTNQWARDYLAQNEHKVW